LSASSAGWARRQPSCSTVASSVSRRRAGATLVVIPCDTAHHWLAEPRKAVTVPILDMIEITANAVAAHRPPIGSVGLLATSGTVRVGLYQRALEPHGINALSPPADEQETVMTAIHTIKSGRRDCRDSLVAAAESLQRRGAEGVILGCTEIPLVLAEGDLPVPIFDPLRLLARASIAAVDEGSDAP